MKIFKKIFDNLYGRNSYNELTTITEYMLNEFLSFQKQQSMRIKNHLKYENDLYDSKTINSNVIVKFDVKDYIKEMNQYFVEKDFYNHTTDPNFHLIILNILVPDIDVQKRIPANIRKDLFIGVLKNIAVHSNLELKNVIKFYWEYISVLENSVNNTTPENILETYKECVSGISDRQNRENSGLNNLQKINLVSDYLNSIGIRSRRDLSKLLKKSNYFRFWFGTLVLILIFTGLMSNSAIYIYHYFIVRLGGSSESFSFRVPLLIILSILIIFRIPPFVHNKTKRKIMISTINLFESSFGINPDVLRVFFRNKYSIEYKKLKRR